MLRLSFLLAFLSLLTINTTAKSIMVSGQIILKNDTINTQLIIPISSSKINYYKLQRKVKYISSNGKKKTLTGRGAIEFNFIYKNKLIRMISKKFYSSARPSFFKLEIDGVLKLFSTIEVNGRGRYDKRMYIEKDNQNMIATNPLRFRSQMTEYLENCPTVVEKIKNGLSNLRVIVIDYNKFCT